MEPGVPARGGVPDAGEVVHAVLQPEHHPIGARTQFLLENGKKQRVVALPVGREDDRSLTSRRAPASS
jgi:hypothetical protein